MLDDLMRIYDGWRDGYWDLIGESSKYSWI